MKETIICFTVLFAIFLGGCAGVPVPTFGIGNIDKEGIESFQIGVTTRQEVLDTLGDPYVVSPDGRSLFFRGDYSDFAFVGVWQNQSLLPDESWAARIGAEHFEVYVDFDDQDRIESLQVDRESFFLGPRTPEQHYIHSSLYRKNGFLSSFNRPEPRGARNRIEMADELRQRQELIRQRQKYIRNPGSETLEDLCAAAENGSPEAGNELGRLYEYGLRGLPKDKGYALFWYQFSGYLDTSDADFSKQFPDTLIEKSQHLKSRIGDL